MIHYNEEIFVNVGTGIDISIADLALLINEITGFNGKLKFNTSKPDGTLRKLMDVSKLESMGFKPQTDLRTGISKVWQQVSDGNFFER
jgi:GDP-L-fucose synthase